MDDQNRPDSEEVRISMQKKIFDYLVSNGRPNSCDVILEQKLMKLSKVVDEAMFNAAPSFDEYMNAHTFEVRLLYYLKLFHDRAQLVQQENSTPGGVSQLTSGTANGDQQPAASVFPTTSGSSNMGSSMDGGEGTPRQMMQVKGEKEEN